jgi:hypothetical protein
MVYCARFKRVTAAFAPTKQHKPHNHEHAQHCPDTGGTAEQPSSPAEYEAAIRRFDEGVKLGKKHHVEHREEQQRASGKAKPHGQPRRCWALVQEYCHATNDDRGNAPLKPPCDRTAKPHATAPRNRMRPHHIIGGWTTPMSLKANTQQATSTREAGNIHTRGRQHPHARQGRYSIMRAKIKANNHSRATAEYDS